MAAGQLSIQRLQMTGVAPPVHEGPSAGRPPRFSMHGEEKMNRFLMTAVLGALVLSAAPPGALAQEAEEAPEQAERIARRSAAGSGSYLGVVLRDVSQADIDGLGLSGEYGAYVESVSKESPAAKAGLQADEVIRSWNGQSVESVAQLTRFVRETPPNRTVRLGVAGEGAERTVSVTLGERADVTRALGYADAPRMRVRMDEMREKMGEAREKMREVRLRACAVRIKAQIDEGGGERRVVIIRGGRGRMGVRLQELTDQLGEYFGVQGGEGALVTSVRDESPAAKAGLQAGDVIVAFGGESVGDPGEVVGSVRGAEAGPMEVTVMRDGQRRTLTVVLEDLEDGECENVFFAPGERHSFDWHSNGDHVFVMPMPRASAPHLRAFRFGAPMLLHGLAPLLLHGLAPMPLHGLAPMAPVMPLHPASPGEVSVPPAPPAAPAPPAWIV